MPTKRWRRRLAVLIGGAVALWPLAAAAQRSGTGWQPGQGICKAVDYGAATNRLPATFLTRILWQESRFHSNATSAAGAEGVAQFMPQTAFERGLADPYAPVPAIAQAARLLAQLRVRFGDLGLAAAAYNAGSGRVASWLRGQSDLPTETREYVMAVTGKSVDDWARQPAARRTGGTDAPSCLTTVASLSRLAVSLPPRSKHEMPLYRALARAARLLDRLPFSHSASLQSLQAIRGLCDRIRALGARCAVYQR